MISLITSSTTDPRTFTSTIQLMYDRYPYSVNKTKISSFCVDLHFFCTIWCNYVSQAKFGDLLFLVPLLLFHTNCFLKIKKNRSLIIN